MRRPISKLFLVFLLSIVSGAVGTYCADLHSKEKYMEKDKKTDRLQKNKRKDTMNPKILFELMKSSKGEDYQTYRNMWLDNPEAGRAYLSTVGAIGNDWESIIQEQILLGWEKNRDLYLSVLKEIDDTDVKYVGKTCGGWGSVFGGYRDAAQNIYMDPILPLCWEAILRFEGCHPNWKTNIFLSMIRGLPTEDSIDPVFRVFTTTEDREVRHESSEVLAKLPKDTVKDRLPAFIEKHKEILYLLTELEKKLGN